ncbi:MAG: hypothetical protein ABI614_16865, partial [Planctomycetota bacterium]
MAKKEQLKQWFLNQQFSKIFDDPGPALYGAESAIAELLRDASDLPEAKHDGSKVAGCLRMAGVLAAFAKYQPAFVDLAHALEHALRACNARDDDERQYETSLQEARAQLQNAWGPNCSADLAAQAIADLVGSLSLKAAQPAATGLLVTTPILAGIVDRGLFHLTIELFECGGGG